MGWDDRLDEQRASAPETPKHRSRKNTRRWCRGKPGVEHVVGAPQLNSWALSMAGRHPDRVPCRWWQTYTQQGLGADRHSVPRGDWRWTCSHVRCCTACGKILERYLGRSCPDYGPLEA